METQISTNSRDTFISVSNLFRSSIEYYKENWKLLAGIQVPSLVIAIVSIITSMTLKSIPLSIFYGIASVLVSGFSWLALMIVITQRKKHSSQSLYETVVQSYKQGFYYLIPASIVGILVFLITVGGLFLLIIPGIYWAISYGFAHYVLFTEGKKGIEALRVSKSYVTGYWWGVAGRSLLFGICVGIIQIFLGAANVAPQWDVILKASAEGVEPEITGFPILEVLSSTFAILIVTPLSMIYTFIMFKSLQEIHSN